MPRRRNKIPTAPLRVRTTTRVVDDLERLIATGYFGKSTSEAAEQVLREGLRMLMKEQPGIIALRSPGPKGTK